MEFSGLKTAKELIVNDLKCATNEEVIKELTAIAKNKGYIEDLFVEKILEREKEYPTGLPTAIPIAIPHIHEGCLESFFSMAILEDGVKFKAMDGSEDLNVRMVFLFGIVDPSEQTTVLVKFSELFQDSSKLQAYIDCADKQALIEMLEKDLDGYIIFA